MARKAKKNGAAPEDARVRDDDVPAAVDDGPASDDEDGIPDIDDEVVDGVDDDDDASEEEAHASKEAPDSEKGSHGGATLPFLDTFYQLSAEASPAARAVAARDLLRHCFGGGRGGRHPQDAVVRHGAVMPADGRRRATRARYVSPASTAIVGRHRGPGVTAPFPSSCHGVSHRRSASLRRSMLARWPTATPRT